MRRAIESEANGARYGAAVDDGANEERVGRSKLNSGRRSTFAALGVAGFEGDVRRRREHLSLCQKRNIQDTFNIVNSGRI